MSWNDVLTIEKYETIKRLSKLDENKQKKKNNRLYTPT